MRLSLYAPTKAHESEGTAMKVQIQRARDDLRIQQSEDEVVWLWTEADPRQPQRGGWYLVLENCALAIRVLISRGEPREAVSGD